MMKRCILGLASGIALAVGASPAHASLIGKTFTVDYFLPDDSTSYGGSTESPQIFVVGTGVETTVNVEGILSISVDFTDDTVTLNYDKLSSYASQWESSTFNGLIFTLVSPGPLCITSFEVASSLYMPGFDASRITVTGSSIAFNWQGLRYDPDNLDNDGDGIAVSVRAVPEPSTIAPPRRRPDRARFCRAAWKV